MRITTIVFGLLLLPMLMFSKVNFFQGSLNQAQRAAATEGKLYFIDFYAAYCLPCKLMDQTTFMDEELGDFIANNYVALKLNVDAFDAYEVRSKNEVKALPTIMVFSSSGKLLESYEGSLTATALRKLLIKHNQPENREKTTPPPAEEMYADEVENTRPQRPRRKTAPQKPKATVKPKSTRAIEPKVVAKPKKEPKKVAENITKPVVINTSPSKPTNTKPSKKAIAIKKEMIAFQSAEKPTSTFSPGLKPKNNIKPPVKKVTQPKPTQNKPVTTITTQPKPKVKGLFEFSAIRHPSRGYGIQIGVFEEYGNVLTEVERIQKLFPERKVIVHIDELKGKTVYRVAIGTFSSYAAAKNYFPKVKQEGFDGFIKNLATLK